MKHPQRCEVAVGDRNERVICREPAHWYLDAEGLHVCEHHAMQYLRETTNEVTDAIDGDPVELDENGEIRRAS